MNGVCSEKSRFQIALEKKGATETIILLRAAVVQVPSSFKKLLTTVVEVDFYLSLRASFSVLSFFKLAICKSKISSFCVELAR
jgi:hypothetical protein